MLNEKVAKLLNTQINKEFYSAYLYLSFSNFYGFYRVDAFAFVTGHHCCQTGIFRIILKEIGSVLKCCQASNSGAYIIRMNTR